MIIRAILFLFVTTLGLLAKFPEDFSKPLERIAFGSCNKHDKPQPVWEAVENSNPDLWIWLGDTVYGDTEDMALLEKKYDIQKAIPGYAKLREQTPVLGTWDDHDYGVNNGDSSYPMKAESQQLALDFLDVPAADPRRTREGIYGSYTFGPEGKQVKVLLIDDRYHSTPPGEDGNLLGEAQWEWLKQELKSSTAQVNLIASGIQVLTPDHRFEKWANFPKSRQALFDFIKEESIPGVVFISGDRHIHEIALKNDAETDYPLVEVTSSGMTHAWKNFPGELNRHRIGPVYDDLGFGLIELNWDATPATISFQIRGVDGQVKNDLTLTLNSVKPQPIKKKK